MNRKDKMKANGLVQSNNGQVWFAFVSEPEAGGCQRSEVQSLRRFNQGIDLEFSSPYSWGDYDLITVETRGEMLRRQAATIGGALRETTLNKWLEFYTPLCSRGN